MQARKKIIFLLLLTCIFSFFSFAEEKVKLRVGVLASCEHLPLVIAKKQIAMPLPSDLDLELDVYYSWSAIEAAFRIGALDLAAITLPKALIMAYEGVPLKIIMVINRNGTNLVFISDEKEKLKDKIIVGTGLDTIQGLIFYNFSKTKNIRLGYDLKYLLAPLNKITSLFKEEKIFGASLVEPYATMVKKEIPSVKLIQGREIFADCIGSVLIVNPQVLKKYNLLIKKLTEAIIKSAEFIEEDIQKTSGKQVANSQIDLFKFSPQLISLSLKEEGNLIFKNFALTEKEIEELMKVFIEMGTLSGKVNLKNIIEKGLVKD